MSDINFMLNDGDDQLENVEQVCLFFHKIIFFLVRRKSIIC